MIELSQAPIYQPQFALLMIYHDIMRLHISMHYPLWMAVFQRLIFWNVNPRKFREEKFLQLENSIVEDKLIFLKNWKYDQLLVVREEKQIFC